MVSGNMISIFWIKIGSDFYHDDQIIIPSRHGSVEDRMISLVEEVKDLKLGDERDIFDLEISSNGHIIHKIGIERSPLGKVIAGGCIPFTVGVILIS